MGIQKYRFDTIGTTEPNGSIPLHTDWIGGPSLAGIRQCPCSDGATRTVYVQGEPDTWFSIPAACMIKGKRRNGYVSMQTVDDMQTGDRLGYRFTMYAES